MASEAVFLTESKLRWQVFHAGTNGLKSAFIKIDGRIYINLCQFNTWLESQRMSQVLP